MLFDKLRQIEERSQEIARRLSDPSIFSQQAEYARLRKEHSDSQEVVERFGEYRDVLRKLSEAQLFAADLARMYTKYAERQRWKVELMDSSVTGVGGFKDVILFIQGRGAWSRLKFERGVHRVQRVPVTESAGRIRTSTVTVAVLPEAEDVDVQVAEKDIRVDVYRSSGPGGQGVNTTDSAVRITHIPTGLVVTCQDERSQIKNRAKAMRVLKARLLERAQEEQQAAIAADRKSQVGTGERSERIRTYNFPQTRVTDHRIGLTLYRLPAVLEGDLDELIDGLSTAEQAERLERVET